MGMTTRQRLIWATLLPAAALTGCNQPPRPNIQAGSTAIITPGLRQVDCSEGGYGVPLPTPYADEHYVPQAATGEVGGLLAILLTSLIGKGVDLIGTRLTERGEEQSLTLGAQLNIDDLRMKVSCFQLERPDGLLIRFALLPNRRFLTVADQHEQTDWGTLEAVVVALNYPQSVDLERSGVRGLKLKIESVHAGDAEPVAQSISLGNAEIGSQLRSIPFEGNPFTSAYFPSPFVKASEEADQAVSIPRLEPNLPFTLRAELTEVRNANALYKAAGEVVSDNSDEIAAAIVKALAAKPAENAGSGGNAGADQPPEGQPPGEEQ
jgi:hypothetical protein